MEGRLSHLKTQKWPSIQLSGLQTFFQVIVWVECQNQVCHPHRSGRGWRYNKNTADRGHSVCHTVRVSLCLLLSPSCTSHWFHHHDPIAPQPQERELDNRKDNFFHNKEAYFWNSLQSPHRSVLLDRALILSDQCLIIHNCSSLGKKSLFYWSNCIQPWHCQERRNGFAAPSEQCFDRHQLQQMRQKIYHYFYDTNIQQQFTCAYCFHVYNRGIFPKLMFSSKCWPPVFEASTTQLAARAHPNSMRLRPRYMHQDTYNQ